MAILGTYIDQASFAFAGSNLVNAMSYITVNHSVGAAPDDFLVRVVSFGVPLTTAVPQVFCPGGNASVATLGIIQGSAVSQPIVAGVVTAIYHHSIVR